MMDRFEGYGQMPGEGGDGRAPWIVPSVSRMLAGDAENAVAPISDDPINKS